MTLYNARSTELQGLLVTKWDTDGNIEAQYETSHEACTCPAGHRHTCRHRQMLPLLEPLADTHWFLDWDNGRQVVDFQGMPQSAYNSLIGKDFKPAKGAPSREDEPEAEGMRCEEDTPAPALEPTSIHGPNDIRTELDLVTELYAKDVTPAEEDTPLPRYNKDYSNSIGKSPGAVSLPTTTELRTAALPWRRI